MRHNWTRAECLVIVLLWELHYQGVSPDADDQAIQRVASTLKISPTAVAAAVGAVKGLRESKRESGTSAQLRDVCAAYFGST